MPCIAKKHEANLPNMKVDGIRDVDYVLTTRELARLIKQQNIDFARLKDYYPNSPLAEYTGAEQSLVQLVVLWKQQLERLKK